MKEGIFIKKRTTIQAVADQAGVSRGTVDRVLNNRTHVSPEIYERVMEAIKITGYLPSRQFHQQVLKNNVVTPIKLGVLCPNWTGHFKTEIFRGIESARTEFEELQTEIFTEECQTDVPQEVLRLIQKLLDKGVQGLALCVQDTPTITERINELYENNIPVITFNSDLPGSRRLCFVGQDYNRSGRIAAELTSKCIPQNGEILAAVGNLVFDGHRTRLAGFLERMQELGFSDNQITTIETFNDYHTTYQKVLNHLQTHPETKAVYMANRSVAGCTEAVKILDRKKHLKIICHDVAENTKLLLKDGSIDFTITQDIFRQGYLPLYFLREYLQKGKIPDPKATKTQISIICSQNLDTD